MVGIYATFSSFIHLSMDIWASSSCWLLWIILQWTWVCRYLFDSLLSTLLCVYIYMWIYTYVCEYICEYIHICMYIYEVELQDHVVVLFLIPSYNFFTVTATFCIPANSVPPFQFIHIFMNISFWCWLLVVMVFLLGGKWYLIVVLMCTSLMIEILASFHILNGHLYIFFGEISILVLY